MEENIKRTIETIQKEPHGKYALQILHTTSYLAPRDIHTGMFSTLITDSETLKSAIDLLSKNSLITVNQKSATLQISKSFQLIARKLLKKDAEEILKLIVRLPYASSDYPDGLHHAIQVLKEFSECEELFEKICGISNEVVSDLLKQERYEEAYLFGDAALQILQETVGYQHVESLTLRTNVIDTLEKMSKNTETVKFLLPIEGNKALPLGNEKARETAIANMKVLYKLDDLDQAVFLAERISRGDMFDTDVLDERTLATWMKWAEKLRPFEDKKAFFILMKLFQKSEGVFSPTDMRIPKIKNTMIQIASNQNNHKENLKMQEFSLELKQEVSSMNDPKVLEVKSNIAMSHTFLGNKKEALAMSQDIANAYEQLYGELDPRTLSKYKQVEVSLVHAGYYGKAIAFSKGICEKLKKAPGMKQKELETKGGIPKLFLKQLHIQGKVDEAERFLQELCAEYSAFPRSFSPEAMANVGLLNFIRSLPKVKLETLHSAAKDGNLSNLIILLKNGVNVNAEDYEGRKPIHYAAENGNNAILCTLLKKGAAYNPADYKEKNPLQLTSNSDIRRLLISVENSFRDFKKGNYQMLDNYISQYSKIINAKDKNGHTLLHWAASLGNQNVVKQLLDAGAEIDQISIKGNTPLHIAVSNGHKEIVESLLQSARRDNRNAFINAKTTNRGTTALHAAAEKGDSKIVDVLLRNGAKYNAQTHDGETAIQLSKDQTVTDILKLTDDLFTRVRKGDLEVIEKLQRLEAHDFEMVINACDVENHTLLQVANDCGRKKMADEIEKISNMLIKTN
ncbi:hypothetical protein TNIN_158211 [Trichonephila inaurata madagascariensis]|uniref:Uncharacterized protein n=1 Tax=Trichonephila inaurata madagascariensis TaxID=2747483 RepID=A0A8X6WNT4_9ARAC|nr:hypothetical protein TNIN_158211 [Trichonephila inaurata madagascariensis]